MKDVAIIGGGLFGSIIAQALAYNHGVTVYDDARAEAGSKPAACLMKPGWFSALGKKVYDPSLDLLSEIYGVREIRFKAGPTSVSVFWVPPAKILDRRAYTVNASIRGIKKTSTGFDLYNKTEVIGEARKVVVAAGIWTQLLVPEIEQRSQAGMAFLWPEQRIEEPFIKVWAPYKQVVAFNRGDGLWVGDGNAILRSNWTETHAKQSAARCKYGVGEPKRLFGIRPYHKDRPCLLREVRPGLWVASGGAKNGTLAAGWCASQLRKALQ